MDGYQFGLKDFGGSREEDERTGCGGSRYGLPDTSLNSIRRRPEPAVVIRKQTNNWNRCPF